MYAVMKRQVLSKRKKAIKSGIPENFLALVDNYIAKSLSFRERSKSAPKGQKARSYGRAIDSLFTASEVLDAHLTNRFSVFSNHRFKQEIKK